MTKEDIQKLLDDNRANGDIAAINLTTGELISWDYYSCYEFGTPDSHKIVDDMTKADWIFLVQKLVEGRDE